MEICSWPCSNLPSKVILDYKVMVVTVEVFLKTREGSSNTYREYGKREGGRRCKLQPFGTSWADIDKDVKLPKFDRMNFQSQS